MMMIKTMMVDDNGEAPLMPNFGAIEIVKIN